MTLIKCFTTSHVDNISPCLRLEPEKVILVGDASVMADAIPRYRAFLQGRSLSAKISICDTRGQGFESLRSALCDLAVRETDPVFDLTGGDEAAVMAVGAMVAQTNRKIRVERYDRTLDCVIDCLTGRRSAHQGQAALRVEELIALHGGILLPDAGQPPENCSAQDIEKVWKLVSKDPKEWNDNIKVLHRFEKHSENLDREHIQVDLFGYNVLPLSETEDTLRKFLDKLQRCGVLTDNSSYGFLDYTYTSPLMRLCTEKAGNVLELKTLLEARSAMENGVPFFHDCRMSVDIDWDGVPHDHDPTVQDTRNEIDVVLMHGCTPLFISCKNGSLDDGELYKLHTVTQRFGGSHAGKMLVAAKLDRKSAAANDSFAQRAWDMDIFLEKNAAKLSSEDWMERFRSVMS